MISLRDALKNHIRRPGKPREYRVNKITFCTADRNRGTGGKRITILGGRLMGSPSPNELVTDNQSADSDKKYRKGQNWLNLYDEHSRQTFRVHLDLIEFVNDIEIA